MMDAVRGLWQRAALYPDAKVDVSERGGVLHPAQQPVAVKKLPILHLGVRLLKSPCSLSGTINQKVRFGARPPPLLGHPWNSLSRATSRTRSC